LLKDAAAGVTAANATGIFLRPAGAIAFTAIARQGGAAPMPGAVSFGAFDDTVLSADGEDLAFPATLKGTGITSTTKRSLWWKPPGQSLALLAQAGTQAPGVPLGAKWKVFPSLAVPGGGYGPLVLGTLGVGPGTVTSANDIGLWSADSTGHLVLILREGDALDGKIVKSFTLLKAVTDCPGVSRSFNDHNEAVAVVTYTDLTTAIVKIHLP
jgi:hypothetical protein